MSDQNKKTYSQTASDFYNRQYESWVPWAEDKYLSWFTKDNKTSYATKRTFPTTSPSIPIDLTFIPPSFLPTSKFVCPLHRPDTK